MIIKKRFYKLPSYIIDEQRLNPLTNDLHLCELTEYLIKKDTLWSVNTKLNDHLLIFCTKGGGFIQISNDSVLIGENQFCIIPKGFMFKFQSGNTGTCVLLTCMFNGKKTHIMEKDFTVVRDLIPSVNNMVANRFMLFDELFNNLNRGYYKANYQYINFCFGHLLATFLYASKTSDDFMEEDNPGISRAIYFMEQNLNRKVTLPEIADEAGYSPSYLITIFRKITGYSPLSYYSHLKITKACEFLDFSKLKIKEISFMLGYSDPYYFSKDFRKKMGVSPRHYRARVLKK